MNPILLWIQANPQAVKAYMVSIIALIAKGIFAATGKVDDLGQWAAFTNQAIDIGVGGLTFWGLIAGTIHVSRGNAPTPEAQTNAIVRALAPAPLVTTLPLIKWKKPAKPDPGDSNVKERDNINIDPYHAELPVKDDGKKKEEGNVDRSQLPEPFQRHE